MVKKLDLSWLGKRHFFALVIIAVLTFSGVYALTSSAACYPGAVTNRTCYRGYFSNTYDQWGDNVLPEVKNGQALPTVDIYNADTFYNAIRAAYFSGNAQRHTGAAFIYNTMMGNDAPGAGRNISDAQWNTLYTYLKALDQAGKIDWYGNVSADVNSYWQGPDTDDDAYYGEFKNEAGIQIRDYNNNVVYRLLRRCANPIGDSTGIPAPQNYTLTPQVNAITPTEIESGAKMTVTSSVNNVGDVASSPTQWEITQITVKPGKKAPHEDEGPTASGQAPCQGNGGAPVGNYFTSADATCRNAGKGSGAFSLGSPAQNLKPSVSGWDIGDVPVGTRICFALSIQPRSNTDAQWGHSKPICTVVGKKPKVQIWGGDVNVRGNIDTSTSTKDVGGTQQTFGSWVEYGAFSVGTNSRFASGSGLNGQTDNSQTAWSKLTFANKDDTGADSFGQYTTGPGFPAVPNIASFFNSLSNKQSAGAGGDISGLGYTNGGPVVVNTATDLTIGTSNIPPKRSIIIIASGTVTIDGNITYANGPFTSTQDIPQVVIIAKNILIRDSVGHVDAWLVASDIVNTCYNLVGNPTSNKCGAPLEVNGPVATGRLLLNRTAGSDTGPASGDPAERFNLRADAFLWANLQARGGSKAQTVYTTELPPRF
jgi:hypothetical protein